MKFAATILMILVMVPFARAQESLSRNRTAIPSPHAAARNYDPALATAPAAAIFGFKEKKFVLVDVRPAADFGKYRIAGSLNIALHALKTKAYLKAGPMVLVNEGFVVAPLVRICRALNQAGFRATILAGGLKAWQQKGGRVVGDPFAMTQMSRITPRQLLWEKGHIGLVMADASGTHSSGSEELFPEARHLSLIKNRKASEALKDLVEAADADPFYKLVIITAGDRENDRIERRLADQGVGRVFFLEGGLPAYETYLEQMQLAKRPVSERKVTTGGCKSCVQDN
jgi:rhodanese-related sulfurtransferase